MEAEMMALEETKETGTMEEAKEMEEEEIGEEAKEMEEEEIGEEAKVPAVMRRVVQTREGMVSSQAFLLIL